MDPEPVILGEAAAAAISAVEGLTLAPEYSRRIAALQSKRLTIDEICETLIADVQTRNAA